jgi:Resolvase, N terminal domain
MRKPDRPKAGQMFRCAIYTRKSSDEGLEQEFNSLDAQREACEAYVTSQRHAGWVTLPDMYDDGGLSGGTMERHRLRRLNFPQNPDETLDIRQLENGLERHGAPSRPTTAIGYCAAMRSTGAASPSSWMARPHTSSSATRPITLRLKAMSAAVVRFVIASFQWPRAR